MFRTKSFTQTTISQGLSNDNSLPCKLMQMKMNHRKDLQSENIDSYIQCYSQFLIFQSTLEKVTGNDKSKMLLVEMEQTHFLQ